MKWAFRKAGKKPETAAEKQERQFAAACDFFESELGISGELAKEVFSESDRPEYYRDKIIDFHTRDKNNDKILILSLALLPVSLVTFMVHGPFTAKDKMMLSIYAGLASLYTLAIGLATCRKLAPEKFNKELRDFLSECRQEITRTHSGIGDHITKAIMTTSDTHNTAPSP